MLVHNCDVHHFMADRSQVSVVEDHLNRQSARLTQILK